MISYKLFAFVFVILACTVITLTSAAYTHGHDGRPGCQTELELTRPWRNNFDPTRYWICEELNKPGKEVLCLGGEAYYDPETKCVPWEDWEWTELYDPPSLA